MRSKILIIIILICTIILTGCEEEEKKSKDLVCTSKAKECNYVAVAGSDIGEEMYVCDDPYGEVEVTFNYETDDEWRSATFITTYDKSSSTKEKYNEVELECYSKPNCSVEFKDGIIVVTEEVAKDSFQNGSYETVKKYMNSLEYDCK